MEDIEIESAIKAKCDCNDVTHRFRKVVTFLEMSGEEKAHMWSK